MNCPCSTPSNSLASSIAAGSLTCKYCRCTSSRHMREAGEATCSRQKERTDSTRFRKELRSTGASCARRRKASSPPMRPTAPRAEYARRWRDTCDGRASGSSGCTSSAFWCSQLAQRPARRTSTAGAVSASKGAGAPSVVAEAAHSEPHAGAPSVEAEAAHSEPHASACRWCVMSACGAATLLGRLRAARRLCVSELAVRSAKAQRAC
mmetsp:Transcript_54032/g.124387  ORF Transcript_54032/g.124387 Transcript_54032/m.124387 type:complete len:208 (-) Transcript_54032:1090-1713(-)